VYSDFEKIVIHQLQDIVDKQADSQKSFSHLDRKVDLHIQKTEYELKRINELDNQQNKLIDQHIEGVKSIKDLVESHRIEYINKISTNANRINKLEAPEMAKKWIKDNLYWIFTTIGLVAGLVSKIKGIW